MPLARILIVEDESIIALDIQNQLLRKGYQVVGRVTSGEMAVQKALTLNPDLILMDIRLEDRMDGIEAARQIQAQLSVPIVYLTAYADEATLQRAKETSPLGYLLKPFEERELDTMIQMALYRYQAEKKLRTSEAQYRTLFEHSPDAILVLVNDRVILTNPAGVQMFAAKTSHDLLGRSLAEMGVETGALLLNTDEPQETTFVRLDGRKIPVEYTAVPAIYEEKTALQIVARDIAPRKQAQALAHQQRALAEALRQTAARLVSSLEEDDILRNVLEVIGGVLPHNGCGIILLDRNSHLFRIQVSNLIANNLDLQTRIQQQWPILQSHYQHQLRTQTTPYIATENPAWAKKLGLDWVQSILTAPIISQNTLFGFVALVSHQPHFYNEGDAAPLQAFADQVAIALQNARLYRQVQQHAADLERRVAQRTAELDQERGRLQAILDAAGEGIYFTDLSGKLLYMNTAIEHMTGYSRAELEGKSPHVWRSTQTPEQTILEMNQAYTAGQPWKGEVVNQRKDGQLYDASLSINPVRSGQGTLQGYVCAQRDITHLKELARLKDAFASQIGHELRTPITNIQLYHDLLARRPEHLQRYMEVLRRETNRLENLVEGFMEISLLNADALPVKRVAVNCEEVLAQLMDRYEQMAQDRQITLVVNLVPKLPLVVADVDLLHRVLYKLLDNALRYTPMGGQVTISTAVPHRDGSDWITCTISDTGPGITPEEQPYLFERFFRGKAAQEFNIPGAGLGLAICREILNKLGGHITFASKPGQGTAFTIWLLPAEER